MPVLLPVSAKVYFLFEQLGGVELTFFLQVHFVPGVVHTASKFATGFSDTSNASGKFTASVVETGGKFPRSLVDTGGEVATGAVSLILVNISSNFRKNVK